MDSGANVSVTNLLHGQQVQTHPSALGNTLYIVVGNIALFHCNYYAHFGSILGQLAIMDGGPDIVLSIAVLTARGYKVRFLPSDQA